MLASSSLGAQDTAAASAPAAAPDAVDAQRCELHVWPTENYIGISTGLLSGLDPLGALADLGRTKKGVATIKDQMREYLGPEVQLEELRRVDYLAKLGLSAADYRVIVHEPTPWSEEVKKDAALKAEVKALNAKIKADRRITDSTTPCYAELITTHIFYHKAMMYGSNLFTGWNWRVFDGDRMIADGQGQVKNPLEEFPPKDAAMIETAKSELRDAYAKNFDEWVEKKSGV